MKIGIISDTHDHVERIKKAIEILNKENNDADIFKLVKRAPENFSFHDRFFVDEVNGKRICMFHGDPEELVTRLFESGKYDLLLRGHNHVAEIKRNEKTLMINPGNLIGKFNESSKSWTEPSVAVYDFGKDTGKIIRI